MKYVDEFRDPEFARKLVKRINAEACHFERPLAFMEICGGHTHTIYRHGLEHLLPENVQFIHGPGCPVCVIPMGRVDDALWLANQPDVILTTFRGHDAGTGLARIPAPGEGARARYPFRLLSPRCFKELRKKTRIKGYFFAIGFETTAPSTAVTLLAAKKQQVKNFSVFSNHVKIEPPLRAIVGADETPD